MSVVWLEPKALSHFLSTVWKERGEVHVSVAEPERHARRGGRKERRLAVNPAGPPGVTVAWIAGIVEGSLPGDRAGMVQLRGRRPGERRPFASLLAPALLEPGEPGAEDCPKCLGHYLARLRAEERTKVKETELRKRLEAHADGLRAEVANLERENAGLRSDRDRLRSELEAAGRRRGPRPGGAGG